MKELSLENVCVRFGSVVAMRSASISVKAGQVLMLIGPNGAGKSTLSRVLLGLVRPDSGIMRVDGVEQKVNNHFKKSLGYLPEAVAFSESLKGRQVLRFFALARGVSRKEVTKVLERVGLSYAANRAVRGYSKGMRQRLGLAVAILGEPELLILDEPTGGLDTEGLSVLWSILAEWREKKRIVVMASHQLALLERRVDIIYVFRKGELLASGSPTSLRETSGLRQRVTLELSNDEEDVLAVREFVAAVDEWPRCHSSLESSHLIVFLEKDSLLQLMDIRSRFSKAVIGLQVADPTLDMVYERLLEKD